MAKRMTRSGLTACLFCIGFVLLVGLTFQQQNKTVGVCEAVQQVTARPSLGQFGADAELTAEDKLSIAELLDEIAKRLLSDKTIDTTPTTNTIRPSVTLPDPWVARPKSPVQIGKFADFEIPKFSVPDVKWEDVQWRAISRSTSIPDPTIKVDSNLTQATVETVTNGVIHVSAFAVGGGKGTLFDADFTVGSSVVITTTTTTTPITNPPVVVDPNAPEWPITEPGLKVLIVYETDYGSSKMSEAQQFVVESNRLRLQLMDLCANDGFRIWDQNTTFAKPNPIWEKMLGLPRDGVPWMVISGADGRKGVSRKITDKDTVESILAEAATYK